MRSIPAAGAVVLCVAAAASAFPVYVDFGQSDPANVTPGNWNNIAVATGVLAPVGLGVANAIDAAGNSTGISITANDDFNSCNQQGATTGSLPYPSQATRDSFFGNAGLFGNGPNPTGGLLIEHLNPWTMYWFTFYASRVGISGENRETQYDVIGLNRDTVFLNPSEDVSTTVTSNWIAPNANGQIQVNVTYGPNNVNAYKFFYLGVMQIDVPEPATLSLFALGGLAALRRRK